MNLTKSLVIFITGMGLFASACTSKKSYKPTPVKKESIETNKKDESVAAEQQEVINSPESETQDSVEDKKTDDSSSTESTNEKNQPNTNSASTDSKKQDDQTAENAVGYDAESTAYVAELADGQLGFIDEVNSIRNLVLESLNAEKIALTDSDITVELGLTKNSTATPSKEVEKFLNGLKYINLDGSISKKQILADGISNLVKKNLDKLSDQRKEGQPLLIIMVTNRSEQKPDLLTINDYSKILDQDLEKGILRMDIRDWAGESINPNGGMQRLEAYLRK